MSLKLYSGGALRTFSRISIQIAGVLRPFRSGKIQTASVLRPFFSSAGAMSLSISPDTVEASGRAGHTITTETMTATPSGGTGPYSYAWVLASHTGNLPTILNPAFASTALSQADSGDDTDTATGTCTATDSLGGTASAPFTANFTYFSPGDPIS